MTQSDRLILEDLQQRIGTEKLVNALVPNIDDDAEDIRIIDRMAKKDENDEHEFVGTKEAILDFICKLEGYQTTLKGLHWEADHKSKHELADEVRDEICKYQDEVAEDMMGFLGIRLNPGDVVPVECECKDLKTLLETFREDVFTLRASIEDEPVCYGLVSMLDDMVHFANKSLYLETFA